jgi:O-antigen ligase
VISFLSFLMMFIVSVTLIDSWERLRWVLVVSVGSVGFASLYVIRQWQQYHNVWPGFRPGGVSGDSNYFTLAVMLSLPLALCLLQEGRTRWVRWLCLACLLAMLPAVGFASSRGGFLGISASMLYLIWRSKKRVRNLILIAATVIPAMTMLPNSPVKRLLHPNYSDKFGEDARRVAWLGGFRMIQQHPVFGIGLGNFRSSVESYEEGPMKVQSLAHNTYIEIAAELGLPTLFVFLAMLTASFISAERMRRWAIRSAAPPFICSAVLSVQASIIACVIGIAFLSAEYQKVVWFTIFLSVSLHSLAAATKVVEARRGAVEGQLGAAPAVPEEIYAS